MFLIPTPPAIVHQNLEPKIEFQMTETSLSLYGCRIDEFEIIGQDPVTLQKRKIGVSVYNPRSSKSNKAVMILPPTGGVNILDRGYANEICTSGMAAVIVSGWEHQLETSLDFNMHNNGAVRAIAASRHVVDFMQMKNYDSIGVLGTSIGAITGALVLGLDSRINSAALIVGSARFADVVAESDEAGAAALRKARMQRLNMKTQEEYTTAIRKAVLIEPSHSLQNMNPKKSLVISADADTTVPTAYQYELAEILKSETHLKLRGDHLQVIKESFWSHRATIAKFFANSLNSF